MPEIAPGNPLQVLYLKPGELYVARKPTVITTLLGSCVAVCLYHPLKGIGAMCHSLLPVQSEASSKGVSYYADSSISSMISSLCRLGGTIGGMKAKLFGGADVLGFGQGPEAGMGQRFMSIGKQNIAAARRSLQSHGVPILAENVGGNRGCKIFFYSDTGEVFLKQLAASGDYPYLGD